MMARGVGGAAAAWWVVICASYSKYNEEDKQVKAQGLLNASSNMGKVVAALAGGLLAQAFGLHAPFYFAFLVALVGIGCIMPQHGVVVSGSSLMAAYSCLERMETDAICNIFKNFI